MMVLLKLKMFDFLPTEVNNNITCKINNHSTVHNEYHTVMCLNTMMLSGFD